jgi:tetrahydromethanopterin S-methyltransferase subunit E
MKIDLNINDKVIANVTKNGYFIGAYKGIVTGFTKTGLVKVSSWKGVKCHAIHNVRTYD